MKKITLRLLIAGLLIAGSLNAQNHEARANLGLLTSSDIGNVFSDLIVTVISAEGYSADNSESTGAIGFEYWYFQSDLLKLGGLFSYQAIDKEVFYFGKKSGNITNSYYTIMPEISLEYVRSKWVQLYSGLGIGVTILNQNFESTKSDIAGSSQSEIMFNFHINAIGLRVGKAFGASVELGIGAKGIFNAGLSYRF